LLPLRSGRKLSTWRDTRLWPHLRVRCSLEVGPGVWQNRLNYSGSSVLVIAIQPILTQRTSNGTTHWSVGSPPDATTVQQDRSRFTSHEGEFYNHTTSHQLLIHRILNIITNISNLSILIQTLFENHKLCSLCRVTAEELNTRLLHREG
jgi:hypothetical protein